MKEFRAAALRSANGPIEFTIDDDFVFHFTPQKMAAMLLPVITGEESGPLKRQFDWLRKGLPAEEYQRVLDRLADDNDPLDFSTMDEVISWLVSEASGRPTT